MSYYDPAAEQIRSARYDGVGWPSSVVDTAAGKGFASSVAIDPAGFPAVSYATSSTGAADQHAVKLARFDGSCWTTEPVTGDARLIEASRLAFDAAGHPVIAYGDHNAGDVRVARFDGAAWTVHDVGQGAGRPGQVGLAIDPVGPMVSYSTAGGLVLASYDGAVWSREVLPVAGAAHTALGLDLAGLPAIAYYTGTGPIEVHVIRRDTTSWNDELVDTIDGAGRAIDLAFDGAGGLSVSYADTVAREVRHAYHDGVAWTVAVAAAAVDSQPAALAHDGAGLPAIAYDPAELARNDGTAWSSETVDGQPFGPPIDGFIAQPSLAFAGDTPIVAYRSPDGGLRVATWFRDNTAPVADAGGPYDGACVGGVIGIWLDGSLSFDPDPGDTLSYLWTTTCAGTIDDPTAVATSVTFHCTPCAELACDVTLTVTDSAGAEDAATAAVGTMITATCVALSGPLYLVKRGDDVDAVWPDASGPPGTEYLLMRDEQPAFTSPSRLLCGGYRQHLDVGAAAPSAGSLLTYRADGMDDSCAATGLAR